VDECIDAYTTLSKTIFRVDQVIAGKIPVGDDCCRFDHNIMQDEIQKLVETHLGDKEHGMSAKPKPPKTPKQCHTFVVAQMAQHVTAPPTVFRSYHAEGVSKSKCAIWEAARATSAAPSFFKPMTVGNPPPPITYVDGGLGYNNPAKLAVIEATAIWPGKQICLVSLGTGHPSAVSIVEESQLENDVQVQHSFFSVVQASLSTVASYTIPKWDTAKNIPAGVLALLKMAGALTSIVTNGEGVHNEMAGDAYERFPYFRFNVERNIGDIGLGDWKKVSSMAVHTKAYMDTFELKKQKIMCAKYIIDPSTFGR
jgi:predicted acylesterase/phospholipase RssA